MALSRSRIYLTSFCNKGHYLYNGRPVGHECYVLPPAALSAEIRGNIEEAREIISTMPRVLVVGKNAKANQG